MTGLQARRDFLGQLEYRLYKALTAHYRSSQWFMFSHRWLLGASGLVLTIVAGSLAFLGDDNRSNSIVIGVISLGATVVIGLQLWIQPHETSERHRLAGSQYASLRRAAGHLLAKFDDDVEGLDDQLDELVREIDQVGTRVPIPPLLIWSWTSWSSRRWHRRKAVG